MIKTRAIKVKNIEDEEIIIIKIIMIIMMIMRIKFSNRIKI